MNNFKSLISQFSNLNNFVAVNTILIDITDDLTTALFLNQVIYWSERTTSEDEYFYKKAEDWYKEIRITKRKLERVVKELKELNLIETKVKKVNGVPTSHYKVNFEKLEELILKQIEKNKEEESENPNNGNSENEQIEINKRGNGTPQKEGLEVHQRGKWNSTKNDNLYIQRLLTENTNKEYIESPLSLTTPKSDYHILTEEEEIIEHWKFKLGLPDEFILTKTRIEKLNILLKEYGKDKLIKAIEIISNTPFLCGENANNWRANIDFLLDENKLVKVLEGYYSKLKNNFETNNASPFIDFLRQKDEKDEKDFYFEL